MGFSASHRRCHRNHLHLRLLSVSAASGVILLLLAFLSFFAPSPVHTEHLRHSQLNNGSDCGVAGTSVFRVPSGGGRLDHGIWRSNMSRFYYGCSNASKPFAEGGAISHSDRYLLIATSGGLNQQRTGITDAVVAARILNATLVVPTLDQKSFWKDVSNFSDIFDVEWFISHLSKDVKIIKELPKRAGKVWTPYTMRVPRKCNARCYESRVLPKLLKKHAVRLTKFDYRLSNRLNTELQKLRCRVNYHALKFADPITEMGEKLVHRMRMRSNHYIALHLRFEPDMLAFSGCYYGGGDKEIKELGAIRRRWKTLHIRNPDKGRRQGRCPLTPEEVGLMLRALGYDESVHIYVASGEIYGGEETLAPLKALFPNFHSKDTLATKEELAPFSTFSSRMAALDFTVCDESDVFVTNNNGNMAKILAGRRRYYGHKLTIRPNAKKLYRLFSSRFNTTWEAFATGVRMHQRGFMGEPMEVKPGRGVFHENPASCICEDSEAKEKMESGPRKLGKAKTTKNVGEIVDYQNDNEDEQEWSEPNYEEEDSDALTPDEPELDELLSD